VQVDPIKPKLKPPGSKLSKLKCDLLLSKCAFIFNLRRYDEVAYALTQKTLQLQLAVKERAAAGLSQPDCSLRVSHCTRAWDIMLSTALNTP
jgi:hypothetical protein